MACCAEHISCRTMLPAGASSQRAALSSATAAKSCRSSRMNSKQRRTLPGSGNGTPSPLSASHPKDCPVGNREQQQDHQSTAVADGEYLHNT
jgi:hypothetical protein